MAGRRPGVVWLTHRQRSFRLSSVMIRICRRKVEPDLSVTPEVTLNQGGTPVGGTLGRIERAILANIGHDTGEGGIKRGPINSRSFAYQLFATQRHPLNSEPSSAHVTRAMRSFVPK